MSTKYPEHDKMRAIKRDSQTIGSFLEWLVQTDHTICKSLEHARGVEYYPAGKGITKLLAEYFEIDLAVIEDEKRAMLDELRAANENASGT